MASVTSEMVATGILTANACCWLVAMSGHGATPNVQLHIAPFTTGIAI